MMMARFERAMEWLLTSRKVATIAAWALVFEVMLLAAWVLSAAADGRLRVH